MRGRGRAAGDVARRAATRFEQQPAREKRKLLRFLVGGCKWTNGHLTYRWKPPFDQCEVLEEAKAA